MTLNLGLRRPYKWSFLIGDVDRPIIGADLLYHYGLLPDLRNKKLIDTVTSLSSKCTIAEAKIHSVKVITEESPYHSLLKQYPDLIRPPKPDAPVKHNVVHYIETTGKPVTCRARRLAPDKYKLAKKAFENMIELGHCRPSRSNWASALHMVPKKDSEEWRPCGDYRMLNNVTIKDKYGVPNILDFTSELAGKKIFSKIDLVKAFNQIPVAEEHIPKTAVITPFGLYEFTRMPFGLCNAPSTFQRFIDDVLRGLSGTYAFVDDVLVASETPEEHLEDLKQVFERLNEHGLTVHPTKCVLGATELDFLGYHLTADGIIPSREKVEAIEKFPRPTTITQLRSFLGVVNFCKRFIAKAAEILAPLNSLLAGRQNKKRSPRSKPEPLEWNDGAEEAFQRIKKAIVDVTLLFHPIPGARLALWVDASNFAIGGVLKQFHDNEWQPLGFMSEKLAPNQKNWSTYDRELLAAFRAVKKFRHMLEGRQFTIFTDQKPLSFALQQKPEKCSPRQFRQLDFISQFTTDIRHVSGKDNNIADALSRIEVDVITSNNFDINTLADLQQEDEDIQDCYKRQDESKLQYKYMPILSSNKDVICEVGTGRARPLVPKSYRKTVFEHLHNLSHPGISATQKLITQRFFWPNMNKDIRTWTKACLQCQRSKVHRHNKAPFGTFSTPDARFAHIHVDLIGPLPPSEGNIYCLTVVDRFTRWPEVFPIPDKAAETVAKALFAGWISRYGCPSTITTDQGKEFESSFFKSLCKLTGTERIRTTAFHPQANGLVERLHRQLKAAIKAHENSKWTETLPVILLGIRSALKEDIGASSAELVFGTTLRLPADIFTESKPSLPDNDFITQLKDKMNKLKPTPTSKHSEPKFFVHKDLKTCSHVMLRLDHVKPALTQPFTGPHKVLARKSKTFIIDLKGTPTPVTIDRLKPAYILSEMEPRGEEKKPESVHQPTDQSTESSKTITTKSGRTVHFPKHFTSYYRY